jgi:oxygen-independent coproporphyrinogen-3 oxidase
MKYLDLISKNEKTFEEETLNEKERYNEMVMTGLRTMWGVTLKGTGDEGRGTIEISEEFRDHFIHEAEKWLASGDMEKHEGKFTLTTKGKLIADRIASDLFVV